MSVVIEVSAHNEKTVITVDGEFDLSGVASLRTAVTDALAAGQRGFVVDFEQATFIDSSAIGAMIAATQDVHRAGGTLVMTHASGAVLRVLTISGVAELIPLQD